MIRDLRLKGSVEIMLLPQHFSRFDAMYNMSIRLLDEYWHTGPHLV
jgi:hypothetical protein